MSTVIGYNYGDEIGQIKTLTGAYTVTQADHNTHFILDAAAGATITLPTLSDRFYCKFSIGAAFATTNWVVASAEGDNINGLIKDMGSTVAVVVAGAEDQINFVATAETIGDNAEFFGDVGNSQWLVTGECAANGGITATDPA